MKDYTVSVCIVTYNSKNIIERTISSIFEQTEGVKLDLFVVDNASSDGTADFIRSRFPQVRVIENRTNLGFGAAHNKVLPYLESKYHIVVNPDIILKNNAILKLCEYADEHENVGLLSPQIKFDNGKVQQLGKRNPTFRYLGSHWFHKGDIPSKTMIEYCMLDCPDNEVREISNATGCFMFFRTEAFKELSGFDERFFMYLEDCDIARRVSESRKYKALFYPMAEVTHLWERGSKKSKKLLAVHIHSIISYFLKWGIKIW